MKNSLAVLFEKNSEIIAAMKCLSCGHTLATLIESKTIFENLFKKEITIVGKKENLSKLQWVNKIINYTARKRGVFFDKNDRISYEKKCSSFLKMFDNENLFVSSDILDNLNDGDQYNGMLAINTKNIDFIDFTSRTCAIFNLDTKSVNLRDAFLASSLNKEEVNFEIPILNNVEKITDVDQIENLLDLINNYGYYQFNVNGCLWNPKY